MLTFGSAMLLVRVPDWPDARRVAIAVTPVAAGIAQPAVPAGGSSASIASLPPLYGSRTAVQPAARTVRYSPPVMNCAVTRWPEAVVNGPGLVSLRSNGVSHGAFM